MTVRAGIPESDPVNHDRCRGGRRAGSAWLAVLAGLAAGLSLAPSSFAQYLANQNGNALAGGLSRNNPYASSGRDFAAEAKYRNSIVFSQAPGGLAFRGRLGYSDPSEFVGRLGTSSLNSFRRNSELSTIAGQGVRRDQVFDAQSTLSTGASSSRGYQPGRGGVNFNSFDTRSAYGRSQNALGTTPPSLSDSAASRAGQKSALRRDDSLDRNYNVVNKLGRGLSAGSRAPTTRNSGLGSAGAFSGAGDASDRLGLSGRSTSISSLDFGRTDYGAKLDGERTLANSAKSRGQAERATGDSQRSRTRVDAVRPGGMAGGRVDTSARPTATDLIKAPGGGVSALGQDTSYDDLRKRLDKLGLMGTTPDIPTRDSGDAPSTVPGEKNPDSSIDWQRRMEDLRSHLLKKDAPTRDRISLIDRTKSPAKPGERKPAASLIPGREGEEPEKSLRSRIDPDTLKLIRDASSRVDNLVSSDAGKRDFYTEHMQAGQKLIADRMYFDAEERFGRALTIKPADVAARTGQIHAQIGAGLSMSAGQHLRRLLAEHPETTGQRYAESLRPDAERTLRLVDQLRTNIAGTGKLRRESALLMAYLGFQTSDMNLAREGLNSMAQVASEDPAARSDERLVELLRGIWLDAKLYEAPPAPTVPAGSDK